MGLDDAVLVGVAVLFGQRSGQGQVIAIYCYAMDMGIVMSKMYSLYLNNYYNKMYKMIHFIVIINLLSLG